jgi:hypothetical protein
MDPEEIADAIVDRLTELTAEGREVGMVDAVKALIATAHSLATNALGPADAEDLVRGLVEEVCGGTSEAH